MVKLMLCKHLRVSNIQILVFHFTVYLWNNRKELLDSTVSLTIAEYDLARSRNEIQNNLTFNKANVILLDVIDDLDCKEEY